MRGTVFSRLRLGATKLLRDQRGNAFMLTAAAIVPVIGIVGSAVDIGRAYMTQLRLQQACDAGVLAGRRAMGAGAYGVDEEAEADKMFNFNFPTGRYGATAISFSSEADGTADVTGTASATLPTALMYIFGKGQFNLSAACTARLEISNIDVMLVLDVTGSMEQTNDGDDQNKITGLKAAAKSFFTTLTSADIGDGQLRFGVVPYSTTVNVGKILRDENTAWLSQTVTVPSRRWGSGQEEECRNEGSNRNPRWVCSMVTKNLYHYEDRTFTVGSPTIGSNGTILRFATGSEGANVSTRWGGCIVERKTTAFGPEETAPADAFDMNIDMVPNANADTQWQLLLPAFVHDRRQVAPFQSSTNFSRVSNVACPNPAMKLTVMTSADQETFDDYIDGLLTGGGTYHDVGMAWGARLISPTGLFADENDATDDGEPIDRHILFMTDGLIDTSNTQYTHQGLERSMVRVGSTSKADSDARHTNRFLQLCRAARDRGITVWVVSFGLSVEEEESESNRNLGRCASSGQALASSNTEELDRNFQSIARQMSKLRLAQ
ncbi:MULTISPECIES: TadE/TadG family protein [unclassified Sphingopyxis]|uniref:TadE/TadG family type IV pilus assembly protein n=1 Tax=unclassified Sphingopyxis TaxID=2614943 RepID=UPI002855D027|nr:MULTISPECIES: TadE/TadG family protein [unclassified Sphingopyxis]MDR7058395.1 Flp pilus assembly protein TadG [Sphingopyxis sp. BE235]MDR7179419.1 Flp pilus assembly protein TadG [Sphingopyxis sp. BE249]